jgi:hypothetical protein
VVIAPTVPLAFSDGVIPKYAVSLSLLKFDKIWPFVDFGGYGESRFTARSQPSAAKAALIQRLLSTG